MPWMIRRWDIIVYFRENNFWQMGHLVCPLWMVLWCANESLRLKTLPHSLHTYFAGLPEVAVGAAGSQAPDSSYTHWATRDRKSSILHLITIKQKHWLGNNCCWRSVYSMFSKCFHLSEWDANCKRTETGITPT